MKAIPTPRTDAETMEHTYEDGFHCVEKYNGGTYVKADFARQLERDLAAMAEREKVLVAALGRAKDFSQDCETAEDRSNLDGDSAEAVLEQINEAAEELTTIIAAALAHPGTASAAHMSGILTVVGTFLVGDEESTGYFISAPREEIEALKKVPLYSRVTITASADAGRGKNL